MENSPNSFYNPVSIHTPEAPLEITTNKIAFLADYVPRQCGIATFTASIADSIAKEFPEVTAMVGAVNDRQEGYDYPERVRFEIDMKEEDSYRRAAEFLNLNNVEVVSIQHEYGIYGGPAGNYLTTFLRNIHVPVVTTLHTILSEPDDDQRAVMIELDHYSSRFIVMAETGREILETVYHVSRDKIDVIPHGVVDVPFIDPHFYKDLFGAEGKTVILTFGLLSSGKGIEYVIDAMPEILKQDSDVVYFIVGATHPNVLKNEGEAYRTRLEKQVKELGLEKNVRFYNRFVSQQELQEFIGAADIYITPYPNGAQITSGTLAYAFGAGKAIISTPYLHAKELLADERGILVPFADSGAIAEGVKRFLANPAVMTSMRKRAWKLGREMIWPVVARRYMESFERARANPSPSPNRSHYEVAGSSLSRIPGSRTFPMPVLNLEHLFRMSDNTGIFQHAIYNVPNLLEGYCTDDNARSYILTVLLQETANPALPMVQIARLASTYVAFLWHAFDPNTGRFRNFMSHSRYWLEKSLASEDSHARALWAVGTALGRSRDEGHRNICGLLFQRGLPAVTHFTSPRSWAFALVAIHEYLRMFAGDRAANQIRDELTNRLATLYRNNSSPDWCWFEQSLAYDNAKLSHALILSGYWTSRGDILDYGLESLRWLLEVQTAEEGHFSSIGCHGFWTRGGEKARFDQQPLEAHAMVSACLEAYYATSDDFWLSSARTCFEWFLGRNDLGQPLYDARTGGCRDALLQDRLNHNQGAESSLAFYLSLLEINRAEAIHLT